MSKKITDLNNRQKRPPVASTQVLTSKRPLKGVRCRLCNKRQENFLALPMMVLGKDGNPTVLPVKLCPNCGHLFLDLELVNQLIRAASEQASKIIKPAPSIITP